MVLAIGDRQKYFVADWLSCSIGSLARLHDLEAFARHGREPKNLTGRGDELTRLDLRTGTALVRDEGGVYSVERRRFCRVSYIGLQRCDAPASQFTELYKQPKGIPLTVSVGCPTDRPNWPSVKFAHHEPEAGVD